MWTPPPIPAQAAIRAARPDTRSMVTLPLISADSGHQISDGPQEFAQVYSAMVDSEMARTPLVGVQADWVRDGDRIVVKAQVTNRAGIPLNRTNDATVHAVVYENNKVKLTSRYVRAADTAQIQSLAAGATAAYSLQTDPLSGVDWNKLAVAVMVDYLPNGFNHPYDMLQAALATHVDEAFAVAPDTLGFLVDPADNRTSPQNVMPRGMLGTQWTATAGRPWISVTPISGTVGTAATVVVNQGLLVPGLQEGEISFVADTGAYQATVAVRAYYGPVTFLYLPAARR